MYLFEFTCKNVGAEDFLPLRVNVIFAHPTRMWANNHSPMPPFRKYSVRAVLCVCPILKCISAPISGARYICMAAKKATMIMSYCLLYAPIHFLVRLKAYVTYLFYNGLSAFDRTKMSAQKIATAFESR